MYKLFILHFYELTRQDNVQRKHASSNEYSLNLQTENT